jgi:hypothetical protein
MIKRFRAGAGLTGLLLLGISLGCDRGSSLVTPSTSPTPSQAVPVPPPATPSAPTTVTSISPTTGSTRGTQIAITGTGFQQLATVTIGDVAIALCTVPIGGCGYVFTSTTIFASAPPHTTGTVDVVVTNRDGQSATLAGAYTYASPESFETNGVWEGGADSNYETPLRFTVENNAVRDVTCGSSPTVTLSPPAPVFNGEFSYRGADGSSMSGRIDSPNRALGAMNIAPCSAYPWSAYRQ